MDMNETIIVNILIGAVGCYLFFKPNIDAIYALIILGIALLLFNLNFIPKSRVIERKMPPPPQSPNVYQPTEFQTLDTATGDFINSPQQMPQYPTNKGRVV